MPPVPEWTASAGSFFFAPGKAAGFNQVVTSHFALSAIQWAARLCPVFMAKFTSIVLYSGHEDCTRRQI
jgi:hypothetical protein